MKSHVIVFPGSNCDRDVAVAIESISGSAPEMVWHKNTAMDESDLIVLIGTNPRYEATILNSRIRNAFLKNKCEICNGFQILIETSLLDGALIRNNSLSFICKDIFIKSENNSSIFTKNNSVAKMPIAHNEGNYFASSDTIKKIKDHDQIAFKYCNSNGEVNLESNPNGSLDNIAGILNDKKNVLGLMPHPERAVEQSLGSEDGKHIFEGVLK